MAPASFQVRFRLQIPIAVAKFLTADLGLLRNGRPRPTQYQVPNFPFVVSKGALAECIRQHDWGATPLGEVTSWPVRSKIPEAMSRPLCPVRP